MSDTLLTMSVKWFLFAGHVVVRLSFLLRLPKNCRSHEYLEWISLLLLILHSIVSLNLASSIHSFPFFERNEEIKCCSDGWLFIISHKQVQSNSCKILVLYSAMNLDPWLKVFYSFNRIIVIIMRFWMLTCHYYNSCTQG